MSKKSTRVLVRVGSGVLIVAILLSIFGVTLARRSFPQVDGEIQLAGLDDAVYVYRDGMGIPHIYAASLHDLFFAQGYVHAQDRFWQMDFWRHIGAGRLAEMFGKDQVETDAFLRTLGWERIAEEEVRTSSPEALEIMNAYSDGVNAYLADHSGAALSLEYAILGLLTPDYEIEPWTPVHSMMWAKAMAWDLGGNMGAEIERAILIKTLSPEMLAELYPAYPQDHPVIVPQIGGTAGAGVENSTAVQADIPLALLQMLQGRVAGMESVLGPLGAGIGSNSWAVSGQLTSTGMPLLANDPHLGIQMPSIWYQVDLHCRPKTEACPYETAGFSFAGVPGVVIGHNDHIAWGFTNVGPDVQDLYIEKVNPDNPDQYEVNGEWVDMEIRTETLAVGGGEPVELTIRSTRHGPIISDTYGSLKQTVEEGGQSFTDLAGIELPENYVVALRWTALEPNHIFEAIWGFNKAQGWDDFREAARSFTVPAQNLLYADVQGNIGYQMPGKVPIRANGDGSLPVPGWTDDYEWIGLIPFEELPYAFNPSEGYIVTANNQVNPWDYPYLITTSWDYGFRADRIVDMIENAPGPIDIPYIQKMQADAKDLNAETLVPILTGIDFQSGIANQAVALEMLADWDFQARIDSRPAAIFEWFWWNLAMDTFKDDLPEDQWPAGGARWFEVMRNLVTQPESPWWDDKATPDTVENRDDIFITAFTETIQQLTDEYGKNTDNWPTWGDLHAATFRNQTLGESGIAPIEALFNRGPFATGGGESLVNATGWGLGISFDVDWLPSMRMIVDLGDMRNSFTVHTTGQSGHAYHPHYDDMAPLWASGQYYSMLWNEQAVLSNAEATLVLMPK